MREIVRPLARALSVACLAARDGRLSSGDVLAQAKQAPPKQRRPRRQRRRPQQEARSSRSR